MNKIKNDGELLKEILSDHTTKLYMPDFVWDDSEDEKASKYSAKRGLWKTITDK